MGKLKAITALILGAFAISGAECGKSTEDPTKDKPGPDTPIIELQGVDTSSLTQREKKEWSSYVGEFLSPCANVPVPLAQCIKDNRDCSGCLPGAQYVMKGVKDGMTREQIEKFYKNRFDPAKVQNVPIDGSPAMGAPEGAPITMVEFADFQCPHCGETAPKLDAVVKKRHDIHFVFKFYVLGKFPNSENAARAAIAAGKQGKFWEMHHMIFANQHKLDQAGLDGFAQQLGLDVSRLHADMQLPETQARITQDHKLGEDLKIEGTPTIFINGRQYDGRQEMDEWINLDLQMMGTKPAPSATTSSAPAAAADAGTAKTRVPPKR